MTTSGATPGLRIGALSKRAGVSEHVLRAWETRYGLLTPARSPGGFRLYSEDDLRRVERMRAYLAQGLSAAEAARAVLAERDPTRSEATTAGDTLVGRDRADGALAGDSRGADARGGRVLAGDGRGGNVLAGAGRGSAGRGGVGGLAAWAVEGLAGAGAVGALRAALDELDERAAHVVLDQLFGSLTIEAVIREVLIPYLHELGDRWSRGEATVAQEHFASNLIRSRLAGMTSGWGSGHGPRALLACPPGERHDIALLSFGLVLRRFGWRVTFLGADSPIADIEHAASVLEPDLVMLSASEPARFQAIRSDLSQLTRGWPVALAGPGASPDLATAVGAEHVAADPVTAAEQWADR